MYLWKSKHISLYQLRFFECRWQNGLIWASLHTTNYWKAWGSRFCRIKMKHNNQALGRRDTSYSRWRSLMTESAASLSCPSVPLFMIQMPQKEILICLMWVVTTQRPAESQAPLLRVIPRQRGWDISSRSFREV